MLSDPLSVTAFLFSLVSVLFAVSLVLFAYTFGHVCLCQFSRSFVDDFSSFLYFE